MHAAIRNRPLVFGRYELHEAIARGGMASVFLGRVRGAKGFVRLVAIKRLHPELARDADFASMFLDEARVASRIRHPHVVSITDVEALDDEVLLVMDYIRGESLSVLAREEGGPVPPPIAARILHDTLRGLQAAHDATDAQGLPLRVVHRDVSPQNILVGADGVARVIDFGVAKAAGNLRLTSEGEVKGKLAYMPPEQLRGEKVSATADVYAAGVCLWELLSGARLHAHASDGAVLVDILSNEAPPLGELPGVSPALAAVVARSIVRDRFRRFPSAAAMAKAIEEACELASETEVAAWVLSRAARTLAERDECVARVESAPRYPTAYPDDEDVAPAAAAEPTLVTDAPGSAIRVADRPRARRRAVIAAAAVTLGIALGVYAPGTRTVGAGGPHAPAEPDRPTATATAADSAEATVVAAPPLPVTENAPPRTASASATVPGASTRHALGAAAGRSSVPAKRCDPPYTLDPAGRRLYKRECL